MKKIIASAIIASSAAMAVNVPANHVVDAGWLAKNAKNVVIVDLSKPKDYAAGHIPGAVNIPKGKFFQGKMGDIGHLLDNPAQVKDLFDKAGINNDSTVVFTAHVKKAKKYTDMTRGLWTAWVYGLKNVAILNGGIEAWSGDLSKDATAPKAGNFTPKAFSTTDVKTWRDIYSAQINKDEQIVDAREMKHYEGKDNDKRLLKHGHIPGAKKVSAYLFAKKDGNLFKLVSADEAKKMIKDDGVDINKPVVLYCNTGHLATGSWFVMKFIAGAKNVGDFDGSMYEYTRTDNPVEQGQPK